MMTILQWLVAHVSGIHRLVYHIGDASDQSACHTAQMLLHEMGLSERSTVPLQEILEVIYKQKFQWGIGDGN